MSTQLFNRDWKVVVDNLDVSALDIEFKVLRAIPKQGRPVPNKCVLTLWNLNEDHRAQLLKRNRPGGTGGISVRIDAGYKNNLATIFAGDLREVSSQRDGTDWKTVIAGEDGGRAWREAAISKSFTKGTPINTVLTQVAAAMGLGLGNVNNFNNVDINGNKVLPHSMTFHGSAAEAMNRVVNSVGLTWSIQNGVIQIQTKDSPLNKSAIVISSDSGLVGSPEAAIDSTVSLGNAQVQAAGLARVKKQKPHNPGVLKLKSLLIPGLDPGRKIVLQSVSFNGGYMITEVESIGQTWSNDWHANMVVRVY